METRKVQQVGGGTYTVSIPVHWANEHGVEAGGTAYLYTHGDGSLVVRWDEREDSALAATTVELDDREPCAAERRLDAAYAAGYKSITLYAPDGITADQRRAVVSRTRTLSGVDVVEETDDRITVRGLLDASDVSIRQSVRQLRFVALSMHEAATAAFAGETAGVGHVVERGTETDRLARLVERHFNRSLVELSEVDELGVSRSQLFGYYRVAHELGAVADQAASIADAVERTDRVPPDDLREAVSGVAADARGVVEDAAEAAVGEGTAAAAHAARDRCAAVSREADRVDREVTGAAPEAAALLARVLDSSVRTAEHGGTIADLALQPSPRT